MNLRNAANMIVSEDEIKQGVGSNAGAVGTIGGAGRSASAIWRSQF